MELLPSQLVTGLVVVEQNSAPIATDAHSITVPVAAFGVSTVRIVPR